MARSNNPKKFLTAEEQEKILAAIAQAANLSPEAARERYKLG